MTRIFIGVDPGKSGAIVALPEGSDKAIRIRLEATEADVAEFVRHHFGATNAAKAVLEKVGAMPKQGVSSTFKFGQSYGFCRGLLIANRIAFNDVTPTKWQTAMQCRTKGNKNVTKAKAQQLFPNLDWRITHKEADALLLAEYCRRTA